MRQDRQYLEKHGAQWRVQMKVPEKLRPIVGKARLVLPLHTDSLANANRDKHKHIAAFKAQLAQAEAELRRKGGQPASPLMEDALQWREAIQADDDEGHAKHALEYRYEEVQRSDGPEKAGEFAQVALGLATPSARW
ncbi:hypothetical protein D3273_03985 [Lichenibacterium minor]|uniref:DUF6538 domain-containing protein n=1 Tax=Lichenibacterium minor TaxID=2316528 RepID=A0A4Q2UAH7_9HYPH|nr:DUF6538 domain-containing protein [Lichenibacterium minor]RYC33630.1 hypothetical protein D3273_03985 [Lichenibacterium minor]